MNDICVVYYDLLEIPDEINSMVNISHFGSLLYKKQKLAKYHESIFKANGITRFYHIQTPDDLKRFTTYYTHSNIDQFIFFTSRFAVVDKDAFSGFLQKIQYIDSSLGVFLHDEIRSFIKINKKELIDFLALLSINTNNATQLIRQNFNHIEKFRLENFYIEIINYLDFVNFLQSNFELRYFNSIQSNGFVIIKKSTQKSKMLQEYSYYNFVPDYLKHYFLKPFDYKESELEAEYKMEKLNIPDLSVQWIHSSINITEFKSLMQRIFVFFANKPTSTTSKEQIQQVVHSLYIDKVAERLESFKETTVFPQINTLISNGTSYDNIQGVFDHYYKIFDKIKSKNQDKNELTFSHGDLCFSNILYDKRIDFIKFIDPKGCLKEEDAYFDKYYDMAKLSHSVMGNYDFINNGLFEIDFENDLNIGLSIHMDENTAKYQAIFKEFLANNQFDYRIVRLCEASLFLSMLPLHIDYPKKVVAFILNSIQILHAIEAEL